MAMDDQAKLKLQAEVRQRVRFLANDCRTLFCVRQEQTEWYRLNQPTSPDQLALGGGNFLMVLGLFSALNFLAKVHRLLTKPDVFVTPDDRKKVKEAVRQVKDKIPELRAVVVGITTRWAAQPVRSCNEKDAFEELVRAAKEASINIGLPPTEADLAWDYFRNQLSHMAAPKGWVEVCETGKKCVEAEALVKKQIPSFRKKNGAWICNVDRLSLDVIDLAEWLCKEIDNCGGPERIKNALQWALG